MKKVIRKFTLITAMFSLMILAMAPGAFAEQSTEVHTLKPYPPNSAIVPMGESPPDSSDSTQHLNVSQYDYQVDYVGYAVYTDKFIDGVDQFEISVENWECYSTSCDFYPQNTMTVTLYSASCTSLTSYTFNNLSADHTQYAYFYNLSTTAKYYLKFSVPPNGNLWTFNGHIKDY